MDERKELIDGGVLFRSLPKDVAPMILKYLGKDDLARCRLVSKGVKGLFERSFKDQVFASGSPDPGENR